MKSRANVLLTEICVTLLTYNHLVQSMSSKTLNTTDASSSRPTFVVNFDLSSVICQESSNHDDLKIFPISILCDGKRDCFPNPGMDDETFPYCSQKCKFQCGPNGTCLMDGGRSLCYCNEGFSGKRCDKPTLSECSNKPCHWLARCTNTFDSHYCTCLPGFEGDGYNCTDIDECTPGSTRCPVNAKCCNIPGSFFCNCTDGYRPKGSPLKSCEDIDECAEGTAKCPTNTTCVNTPGSYECSLQTCKPGYHLDSGSCVDIDECKDGYRNGCDQRALCQNTEGGFNCSCPAGFNGDGKTCSAIVDCTIVPTVCHKDAFCSKDEKQCRCKTGYIGDGLKCYDVNECANDPTICESDQQCLNLNGSYLCCHKNQTTEECKSDKGLICDPQCAVNAECKFGKCQCKSGYVGDPLHGCMDFNECASNTTTCPPDSWCVNLDGSFLCCDTNSKLSDCQVSTAETTEAGTPCEEFNDTATESNLVSSSQPIISNVSSTSKEGIIVGIFNESSSQPSVTSSLITKAQESGLSTWSKASISTGASASTTSEVETTTETTTSAATSTFSTPQSTSNSAALVVSSTTVETSTNAATSAASVELTSASSSGSSSQIFESSTSGGLSSNIAISTEPATSPTRTTPVIVVVPVGPSKNTSTIIAKDTTPLNFTALSSLPLLTETSSGPVTAGSSSSSSTNVESTAPTTTTSASLTSPSTTTDECESGEKSTSSSIDTFTPVNDLSSTASSSPWTATTGRACSLERTKFCQLRRKNCVIRSGETRCTGCIDGYFENESGVCVESIPCANATDCDPNAKCLDLSPYGHSCTCKPGYIGDGHKCDDVDECYIPNICSPDATCRNTVGSFICTCNPGFIGDGQRCSVDPNDCSLKEDLCHRHAHCIESRCCCKHGYVGNGLQCSPLFESSGTRQPNPVDSGANFTAVVGCTFNPFLCDPNADCVQNRCICRSSFYGDGLLCFPYRQSCSLDSSICLLGQRCIDGRCQPYDCLASGLDDCPANARCIERRCQCIEGFRSHGPICLPILQGTTLGGNDVKNDGATQSPDSGLCFAKCHSNAACIQNRCQCLDGYVGNGETCVEDPNDCIAVPTLCHPKAICLGRRNCSCLAGYEGDGRDHCYRVAASETAASTTPISWTSGSGSVGRSTEAITSIRLSKVTPSSPSVDCRHEPFHCHSMADCTQDGECVCQKGFIGDGTWCAINTTDCNIVPMLCNANASCIETRCQCLPGFVGDGFSCYRAQETDCRFSASVCHKNALCLDGACQCAPGFVGDGLKCEAASNIASLVPIVVPIGPGWGPTTVAPEKFNQLLISSLTPAGTLSVTNSINESSADLKKVTDGEPPARSLDTKSVSLTSQTAEKQESTTIPASVTLAVQTPAVWTSTGRRRCYGNGAGVCHPQARCVDGYCVCKLGYKGDGCASCQRLTDHDGDCFVNPDLCHEHASCFRRRCQCNFDYIGDGITCRPLRSNETLLGALIDTTKSIASPSSPSRVNAGFSSVKIETEPTTKAVVTEANIPIATVCSSRFASTCSRNAECLINNVGKEECQCYSGFIGNGTICDDINECTMRMSKCLENATCVNTQGSFMCLCPKGQTGDGINYCGTAASTETEPINVECEKDGITLVLNKTVFVGKMFVKGQHSNPACSRNFTSSDRPLYKFKALFADCDVKMEDKNTFSTVVVVQKHPLFITQGDEAFKLRCTYPAGEISLMSHYNISMLSTSDTLLRDGAVPQCNLAVASTSSGQTVDEATVGELLQLKLSVSPRDTFALIARNCVALNMETGERYQLTDTDGCAVDPVVFPEWRQETPSDLYANFLTFKWPDTAQIRFQCDCSPCIHRCEPVDCNGEKSYGRRKKRQIDHWASANQVYSSVLIVKNLDSVLDDEASALEDGLTNDANQTDHQISIDNTDVCFNTGVLAAALALAICLVTTMTGGLVLTCYRRKSAVEKILRRIPVAECDFFDTTTSKLGHGYHSSSTLCDTRTSEYSAGNDPLRNNDDLKVL